MKTKKYIFFFWYRLEKKVKTTGNKNSWFVTHHLFFTKGVKFVWCFSGWRGTCTPPSVLMLWVMNSKENSRNILGMYDFHNSTDIFGQFFSLFGVKINWNNHKNAWWVGPVLVVPIISVMCTIIPTYLIIKLILVH